MKDRTGLRHGRTWGRWTLDAGMLVLDHPDYEVDLERVDSGAEALDWIAQVAGKSWATVEDVGFFGAGPRRHL